MSPFAICPNMFMTSVMQIVKHKMATLTVVFNVSDFKDPNSKKVQKNAYLWLDSFKHWT